MKKVLFSLVLLGFSQATMANSSSSERETKFEVYRKAANYIDAVHCLHSDNTNILENLRYVFKNTRSDEIVSHYYVLLEGDQECAGGSGSSRFYLVPVIVYGSRVVVEPINLFEGLDFPHRFIQRVKQEGNNLIITNRELDDFDNNNFPTLEYQYKIALPDNLEIDSVGTLRILQKKFLRKVKDDQ